jgi:ATP-dependent DNA ligase
MKATAVTELPQEGDWTYEIKWDGYRALTLKHGDDVRLLSLKQKSLTSDFPGVAEALGTLAAHTAVVDGEIVAVDAHGRPSFQVLQNRKKLGRGWNIVYYAFDLLNLEEEDLQRLPLHERKARLKKMIAATGSPVVRYSAELSGSPTAVIRAVGKAGLEGVVAKKRVFVSRRHPRYNVAEVEIEQVPGIRHRRIQARRRKFPVDPGWLLRCEEADLCRESTSGIQPGRPGTFAERVKAVADRCLPVR